MRAICLILSVTMLILMLAVNHSEADKTTIIVIPPQAAPQWTVVPGAPGVHYAPNLQQDIFRYGSGYYCYQGGKWYQNQALTGPWAVAPRVPQAFYSVESSYFKQPPGWAKGKKKGWHGASMPPGQMKKYSGEEHVPPGKLKKYYR